MWCLHFGGDARARPIYGWLTGGERGVLHRIERKKKKTCLYNDPSCDHNAHLFDCFPPALARIICHTITHHHHHHLSLSLWWLCCCCRDVCLCLEICLSVCLQFDCATINALLFCSGEEGRLYKRVHTAQLLHLFVYNGECQTVAFSALRLAQIIIQHNSRARRVAIDVNASSSLRCMHDTTRMRHMRLTMWIICARTFLNRNII